MALLREPKLGPASSETPRTLRNFMHENRETSVAPDVVTGRSGKAIGRAPDMHAAEESDLGVVPMNQPNKSGKPQAEVGQGRPGIKGTSRNLTRISHTGFLSGEKRG
jgi:hypothetical protein